MVRGLCSVGFSLLYCDIAVSLTILNKNSLHTVISYQVFSSNSNKVDPFDQLIGPYQVLM